MQNLRGRNLTTEQFTWKTHAKAEVFDMEMSKPSKVWHPAAAVTKYAQVSETPAGSIPLMTSTWRVQCKCKPAEIAVSLNLTAWSFGDFQGSRQSWSSIHCRTWIWLGSKKVNELAAKGWNPPIPAMAATEAAKGCVHVQQHLNWNSWKETSILI